MNKSFLYIVLASISICLGSCLEPFDFQTESYEEVLVVDGLLTNETKSHHVTLSYTYPLDSGFAASRIDDALVYIEDDSGNTFNLYNEGNGVYQTLSNIRAEEGKQYRLNVTTPNNQVYQSAFESFTVSPPIDSIYDRYVQLPNEETNEVEGGIQFFLDTHDDTNQARFFRYNYDETYKIKVPFPSQYIVEDSVILPRASQVGECYGYGQSNSLIIGTSISASDNRLSEFPVRLIFENSQQLRTRYSILVKQYAISEDAYLYYRKLKENNESSGSLFDKQSGTIIGNISSQSAPNEPVLGYFEVSGVSDYREFFNPRDFSEEFRTPQFKYRCNYYEAVVLDLDETITYINTNFSSEIYTIVSESDPTVPDSAYIFQKTCTNCSWYADTDIPSYWIE